MSETTGRVLRLLDLLQSATRCGRGRSSPTVSASRPAACAATSNGSATSATRSTARKGVGGGYQLGSGRALPPLLLDDDEAVAVAVCLRLAAGGTVAGVGEAALRTLAKLDQVLPGRLRAQVEAVHEATVTLDSRARPSTPTCS